MITVKIRKLVHDIELELDGHASPDDGENERVQVCAAVSAMAVGLLSYVGTDKGEWKGDRGGYLKVRIPMCYFNELQYFLHTLELIDNGYPGHIDIQHEGPVD